MSRSPEQVRVLLVDDNPAILRQVIQLLPERFEVVETLDDGTLLGATVAALAPDVVVLDITLPRLSGIALAQRLLADGCESKIVFLTVHADVDYANEAFAVGANGYVVKPRLATDLVPALEAAIAGRRFVSPCPELRGAD